MTTYPLDLEKKSYSYVERPNPAIIDLLRRRVLAGAPKSRILDIGCGCGANAGALKRRHSTAWVTGIEPSPRAAALARSSCDEVFVGTLQDWVASHPGVAPFDAVVLSDVLEHVAAPVPFLRDIVGLPGVRDAQWIVSVPNYAVWYNRLRTLVGRQQYAWSGLWDRTHLRFYTLESSRELLEYCGLSVVRSCCNAFPRAVVGSRAPHLFRKGCGWWGAPRTYRIPGLQGIPERGRALGVTGLWAVAKSSLGSRLCSPRGARRGWSALPRLPAASWTRLMTIPADFATRFEKEVDPQSTAPAVTLDRRAVRISAVSRVRQHPRASPGERTPPTLRWTEPEHYTDRGNGSPTLSTRLSAPRA